MDPNDPFRATAKLTRTPMRTRPASNVPAASPEQSKPSSPWTTLVATRKPCVMADQENRPHNSVHVPVVVPPTLTIRTVEHEYVVVLET
jgi:hypothetical protein